jgi:hypothetical protein
MISALTPETELPSELHPIAFMNAWNLTKGRTADLLGIEPRTLDAYCYSPKAKARREPKPPIKRAAAVIHENWLLKGLQPPNPAFLSQ